jgi:uncharacterized protein
MDGMMPEAGWYYRLSDFFKEKMGHKVYKIPLDAGFTCPNRDGTISVGGCIYCYNPSFSPQALRRERGGHENSVREQLLTYMANMRGQGKAGIAGDCFLAYFQSYTNTYGDFEGIKGLYEEALATPGILGLSVATRPDCLSPAILDLLTGYAREHHIWLELGLQSSHDRTLQRINRGHDYACFRDAVLRCRYRGIYVCAHIIDGLPGETKEDMLETIHKINELPLQGIKFHQLQVLKGTPLFALYEKGGVTILQLEEYLEILCRQLEILRADIAVHRLLGGVTDQDLVVAPKWRVHAGNFARRVEAALRERGTWQGMITGGPK